MSRVDELSPTDRAFLDLEARHLPMHVGAVLLLGPSELVSADGAVDVGRIAARVERDLLAIPRFRQKVARVPGLGAAWVDDEGFRFETHVHRGAVVRPGGASELFELAGVVFSQPLDLDRPLWEMWIVEGLPERRLALILKAHHALVDGMGGLGVLASLLRLDPEDDGPAPSATPSRPPTAPRRLELVRALSEARVRHVGELVHEIRAAVAAGPGSLRRAGAVAAGLVETLRTGVSPATQTAINPDHVSPRRAFAGASLDLARLRAVRTTLGGTINDLAVAIVTGALRRVLARRGDDPGTIPAFRALVPVNLRTRHGTAGPGDHALGNHIALVLADLPIAEADPRARHAAVRASLDRLKEQSHEVEGTAFFERVGDVAGPNLVSLAFSVAGRLRSFNVVITNMVGPSVPLHFARAPVEAIHPLVPLFDHQGLSVALVGYAGAIDVGLFADREVFPDVAEVGRDLVAAFEELEALGAAA